MKKLFLAVAVLFISAATVNAQTKFSIAGNIGATTTSGGSLAAGGDLQVDLPATTGLKITISGGYESFGFKVSGVSFHSSYIPLLAGAKFNLSTNLYGHAQLGYSLSTASGGTGAFTYAPSIGYMVSKNFDISAKYIGLSRSGATLSGVVARLAYNL
jgi:hypothetical protein